MKKKHKLERQFYGNITMGQKANPNGLRLNITRTWDSLWFSKKNYAQHVREDIAIRKFLEKNLHQAGLSRVIIERKEKKPQITAYVSKPGLVIGKKGSGIEQLVASLKKVTGLDCDFNIVEVRKPELHAAIVAADIASQIERRVSYKRATRKAIQSAMKMGAKGIKVACSGRLGGIEIARSESYHEGSIPMHTLRSDVDFAKKDSHTTTGIVGIKVWIYRGDVLEKSPVLAEKRINDAVAHYGLHRH